MNKKGCKKLWISSTSTSEEARIKMSDLIPITRIYDIYPKYTYSNDVKKFMDEIVDIDRANVFTKADVVDILGKIRAEIEKAVWEDAVISLDGRDEVRIPRLDPDDVFDIIDKYKAESEE